MMTTSFWLHSRSGWLALLATFTTTIAVLAENHQTKEKDRVYDSICGPRCVQYILRHYGIQVELHDLIRECQWPDVEAGASLNALIQSLNSRGIHTLPLKARQVQINWDKPILAYVDNGEDRLGHFVVLQDLNNGDAKVWNAIENQTNRFAIMVFTDDAPIDGDYIRKNMSENGVTLIQSVTQGSLVLLATFLVASCFGRTLFQRRKLS